MKHARQDYARIQDPEGRIPEDEPVFLLRAQDRAAAPAVRYWAETALAFGASPEIVEAARRQASAMEAWHEHKTPDMPDGADPAAPPRRASGWIDIVAVHGVDPDTFREEVDRQNEELARLGVPGAKMPRARAPHPGGEE